jgi:hypothetical protein
MNTNNTNPFQATIDEIAALGDQKKRIEKALKAHLAEVQNRFEKEKAQIIEIIEILNGTKSTPEKKTKRKSKSLKLSDAEILEQVKVTLTSGIKLSQSAIMEKLGISYPKFKSFLQNHPDLLGKEGNKKTSVLFLK